MLAFPCNQFGAQEPGDAEEIKNVCSLTYDVSFPLMAKIDVNGDDADPVFKHLKKEKTGLLGSGIKWNFTKFLEIGRASCRERVCQYVSLSVVAVSLKKKKK